MAAKGSGAFGFLERWRGLSRGRQAVAMVLAAALIAFFILIFQHASRPQYVTLYSNLDPAQASPLLQELRQRGVPYRLEDFGTTIKVPVEMADELRIELAGKGLPFAQGLGFELFDEDRLGMTDFERQVKLQRALQEELRRTITSLDAVTQARVHLVLPEPRLFLRERAEPSAAVYLKLNPFVPLREDQVRGIVFLVASSVEGLKPENIIIIDSQGNLLYDAVTADDPLLAVAESTMKQLEVKRSFERELERRVQGMLERVFGPGRALALVTTEMDFDTREFTAIVYDEEGVPRSTQLIEERFEGEGPVPGEVGEANYPGYVGIVPGGESNYERREEIVNYEIGERRERIITAPGKVLRMHTSVVVDTGRNPLTQDQIRQVNELVAGAIGFDEERGDQISVQGMNFDTTFQEEMEAAIAAAEAQKRQEEMFQQAVLGAAAVAVFILVLVAALRRRRALAEMEMIPAAEGPSLEELLAAEEEYIPEIRPEETPQGRAKDMVEKNPEIAASVLKTWLMEE